MNKRILAIWTAAVAALVLSGCGGGGSSSPGGGDNNGPGSVIGKVVDLSGNPVPGAVVQAGGQATATLGQGGYQLGNVGAGVQTVSASVTENGTTYSGSTQALVPSGGAVSNANIAVSPSGSQATIIGTVRDGNGRILSGARVQVGVFVTPSSTPSAGDGSVASLTAFTDGNGQYRLLHVPAPAQQLTLAASLPDYANQRVFVSSVGVGETVQQDFSLPFGGQSSSTPTNVQAFAFTQPAAAPHPSAVKQGAAQTAPASVYAAIRQVMSPGYAARLSKNSHAAQSTRRHANASSASGSYTTEADVFFDNTQSDSVTGFRIYSASGGGALQAYDFLQDPLANIYIDLDPAYTAGQTYSFAVSAVGTGGSESGLSGTSSFVPLDLLTVSSPASGQTVSNPVFVSWNPVSGASHYSVFVYDAFPGPDVSGTQYDAGGATFLTLPTLPSGTYYLAVAGATSDGSAATVSAISKLQVP